MAYISRDPFARQELHRSTVRDYHGATCQWCGSKGRALKWGGNRLFQYETQTDGGRTFVHGGVFCGKSCHDAYHG